MLDDQEGIFKKIIEETFPGFLEKVGIFFNVL
jgi:hypothetical protein